MKYVKIKRTKISMNQAMKGIISVILMAIFLAHPVSAATLENVLYSPLPTGKIQINLKMSGRTTSPKVFNTQQPARIVFDFFDLDLNLDETKYKISQGAVDTLSVVKVADRVRVVLNLLQQTSYTSKFEGDQFIINVDGIPERTATIKAAEPKAFSQKDTAILNNEKVEGIDFRRTSKGGGSIIIDLSDSSTAIDLIDRGSEVDC